MVGTLGIACLQFTNRSLEKEALGATIFAGLGVLERGTAQWTSTEAILPANSVALNKPTIQIVGFRKTKHINGFSRERLPAKLRLLKHANTNLDEH